jgi:tRNA pseudouridine55 synthase
VAGRARRRGGPHGIAVIDKPEGPTSFAVMRAVQRRLGAARAGHAGTLDPAASGVLVVLLGEATKLSAWIVGDDKEYRATVALGVETDTLDREGEPVATAAVPPSALDPAHIAQVLAGMTGPIAQVPPVYSAIKRGGRSLMSRARAGEAVDPEPRAVTCHALTLEAVAGTHLVVHVSCGKGYYVRSLARDLARALGTVGHVQALRRLRSGDFTLAQAVAPDALDAAQLLPLAAAVPDVAHLTLDPLEAEDIRQGRPVPARQPGARALLLDPAGLPLAMAERTEDDRWRVARGLRLDDAP